VVSALRSRHLLPSDALISKSAGPVFNCLEGGGRLSGERVFGFNHALEIERVRRNLLYPITVPDEGP
jgi:hypothetical protein